MNRLLLSWNTFLQLFRKENYVYDFFVQGGNVREKVLNLSKCGPTMVRQALNKLKKEFESLGKEDDPLKKELKLFYLLQAQRLVQAQKYLATINQCKKTVWLQGSQFKMTKTLNEMIFSKSCTPVLSTVFSELIQRRPTQLSRTPLFFYPSHQKLESQIQKMHQKETQLLSEGQKLMGEVLCVSEPPIHSVAWMESSRMKFLRNAQKNQLCVPVSLGIRTSYLHALKDDRERERLVSLLPRLIRDHSQQIDETLFSLLELRQDVSQSLGFENWIAYKNSASKIPHQINQFHQKLGEYFTFYFLMNFVNVKKGDASSKISESQWYNLTMSQSHSFALSETANQFFSSDSLLPNLMRMIADIANIRITKEPKFFTNGWEVNFDVYKVSWDREGGEIGEERRGEESKGEERRGEREERYLYVRLFAEKKSYSDKYVGSDDTPEYLPGVPSIVPLNSHHCIVDMRLPRPPLFRSMNLPHEQVHSLIYCLGEGLRCLLSPSLPSCSPLSSLSLSPLLSSPSSPQLSYLSDLPAVSLQQRLFSPQNLPSLLSSTANKKDTIIKPEALHALTSSPHHFWERLSSAIIDYQIHSSPISPISPISPSLFHSHIRGAVQRISPFHLNPEHTLWSLPMTGVFYPQKSAVYGRLAFCHFLSFVLTHKSHLLPLVENWGDLTFRQIWSPLSLSYLSSPISPSLPSPFTYGGNQSLLKTEKLLLQQSMSLLQGLSSNQLNELFRVYFQHLFPKQQ